jgi:aspartate/methionine/tyrosine aminotransferase
MCARWSVDLDWKTEVMINTGASQAFDAMSRAFEGRYVLLPALSLPTVGVVAAGNGADLLRLPLVPNNGMIDLEQAQAKLDTLPVGSVRFLYLNSPVNPTGQVASLDYLTQLVEFARHNGITVLHDMDSWYTHHSPAFKFHNILEVPGAMDCCVTVLWVSKEFGLPGLRVGLIAGNAAVVNAIRMHNSAFAVMIPEVCQVAAQVALESFIDDVDDNNNKAAGSTKEEIHTLVTSVLKRTIDGWRSLGWSEDSIQNPVAGFKYLVSIPPGLSPQGRFSPVELLDFYIASRAHVKLSTSRSFNPEDDRFLRMVLMQNVESR